MRIERSLNFDWKFIDDDNQMYCSSSYDDISWKAVDLPHSMKELDFHYINEEKVAQVGWYRKTISSNYFSEGKRNCLKFEGVATRATVYLNGLLASTHDGAFTPFTVDIPSQLIAAGEDIEIAIRVDARETLQIPPYGHVIDYLIPGGIYREVTLQIMDNHYIEDVFCYSKKGEKEEYRQLYGEVTLSFEGDETNAYSLEQSLLDSDNNVVSKKSFQILHQQVVEHYQVGPVVLWDLDNPALYTLVNRLLYRGEEIDCVEHSIGFRDAYFTKEGFFLNDKKVVLRGLNRHQLYPYVGFAMPSSGQIEDADFLKNTLHLNVVRTAHYPQSPHFLDRCGQLGLLVFTELPGWQHIGKDESWRESALQQLKEMIVRDRNHPSVILYGVRINESQDDDELYKRTNELARFFDPSRMTGGVRNIAKSRLLEDVYTYNDFSQPGLQRRKSITGSNKVPYLVSEHTGHMYPVRFEENQEKQNNLALFHAKKLEQLYRHSHSISGTIGWCMSDYYTHHQFGSGDNVCHHGVSDQFRIMKTAGYLYASQGENPIVLHLSNDFFLGKYPAHAISPLYIYTNCDSIKLYCNDTLVGHYFPDTKQFPSLPHPPVIIEDTIGKLLEHEPTLTVKERQIVRTIFVSMQHHKMEPTIIDKLKFLYLMKKKKLTYKDALSLVERYILHWDEPTVKWKVEGIKNKSVVKELIYEPFVKGSLVLIHDEKPLVEKESYDVKRIVVQHVDQNGQILPLSNEVISITLSSNLQLIGPSSIALRSGQGAFYVRSKGKEGEGKITVTSSSSLSAATKVSLTLS